MEIDINTIHPEIKKLLYNSDGSVKDFGNDIAKKIDEILRNLKNPNVKGYLITINPKADVLIGDFTDKVEKSMRKKWIKKSNWCFEWRKDDTGLHCHAVILYDNKRLSEMKREFLSTFKKMIGNDMHINFKYVGSKEEYDRSIKYLEGYKKGNPKNNFGYDKINREKYLLDDIYEHEKI